jgi:hypothetical protein
MRSHALGATALGLLLFLSPAANAGFSVPLDNPDLVDVLATSASASKLRKNFTADTLTVLRVGNSGGTYYLAYAYAYGTAYATNGSDNVGLAWLIYEPDEVVRSSSRANLSQATWLGISLTGTLFGSPVSISTGVHDCKGRASFTTKDGGTCDWKVSCGGNAFFRNPNGPLMSDTQQKALNKLIGSGLNSKTTKGGCPNVATVPPPP